jgi:hypothetical protein
MALAAIPICNPDEGYDGPKDAEKELHLHLVRRAKDGFSHCFHKAVCLGRDRALDHRSRLNTVPSFVPTLEGFAGHHEVLNHPSEVRVSDRKWASREP